MDRKEIKSRYRWIDEELAEIKKMGLREIGINLDWQRDIKKYRWIDKK